MKDNKSIRQSNIELLRIVAMIMIIFHHITCHCFINQLENPSIIETGLFNKYVFYKKLLLPQFFMASGKISNIIFILIAGYFLINKKVDLSKQIKKLIGQLIFVTLIIVILSFLYYKYHYNMFLGIQKFDLINSGYWFIGYYIGIISIAYLFLNKYLNKLDKKQYTTLLLIMFSICSLTFLRSILENISINLLTFFVGVFIYSLGGYIRLYNPFSNVKPIILLLIIIISISSIFINNYNDTLININLAKISNIEGLSQKLTSFSEYNIFCLLIGISLFELFKRLKIKNNKIINYISASTFIIYILHDNDFFRNIWRLTNWVEICHNNYLKFLLLYLIWALIIFIMGIIIYSSYNLFIKMFNSNKCKKLFLCNK